MEVTNGVMEREIMENVEMQWKENAVHAAEEMRL
jgi:hypothetical protein